MMLPNFAQLQPINIIHFHFQGKSKIKNVVDVHNLHTHFMYYVALSRGTTAEGTIILQIIDPQKITKV